MIVGSEAAVAFVNADTSTVRYNTIVSPTTWVIRILQEQDDPSFVPSRNGIFVNNLVAFNSGQVQTTVNIGDGTAPETFQFTGNWWFSMDDPSMSTPILPTVEEGGVVGVDPMFVDAANGDFHLIPGSPALNVGAYAP